MFDEFHFLRPLCLLAFFPLVALIHFWVKKTHGRSKWLSAINSELLSVLIEDNAKSSGTWLKAALLFALFVSVIGLAGPTWEKLPQNVEQKNDALVILLDLSLSMLGEDIKPSRMIKAKQKVIDILRLRKEGLTGLIAYAGDAHSVVPLTDDNATIENLLVALDPTMMPVFGSNPEHAMTLAVELFSNAGMQEGRVLVISDGIDDISSVSKFRNSAFPISVIGVGTSQGTTIPIDLPGEGRRFIKDPSNEPVIVRLEEDNLAQVANQSFGRYARLSIGEQDISRALSTSLPTEDASIKVEREFDTWADQGHWVTLLLLPLVLIGFRRGVLACLPIALAIQMTPMPSHAQNITPAGQSTADSRGLSTTQALGDLWAGAWLRGDQRGYQALAEGDTATAATLFTDPQWKAAADYKNGDWQRALNGFGAPGDSNTSRSSRKAQFDTAYNKGNALAHLGQYDNAIKEYGVALAISPNDEDASFNKELVETLKEQKQEQEQQKEGEEEQQQQEEQDSSENSESQPNQEQESAEQQQNSESENQEQPSEKEQQQKETEAEQRDQESEADRDEKQEALEQWLRRVPDNPGGLLKRKFQYETKQRLRQGDYSNQQGEQIW